MSQALGFWPQVPRDCDRTLAIAALILLGGCGAQDAPPPADGAQPPTTATPAYTARASTSSAPDVALTVEGEGLRLFVAATGSARPIAFGAPESEVRRLIATALGSSAPETGHNAECRLDYATWAGGLTATFRDSSFAGWSLRDGTDSLTTASGIGIGSTRSSLESAYAARVYASSLGVEFSAGGLAGVLDSSDAGSRVTAMWAGETCIAR